MQPLEGEKNKNRNSRSVDDDYFKVSFRDIVGPEVAGKGCEVSPISLQEDAGPSLWGPGASCLAVQLRDVGAIQWAEMETGLLQYCVSESLGTAGLTLCRRSGC